MEDEPGYDTSNRVGIYHKGQFSLIDSLSDLLTRWKLVQNGKKVKGYNLYSWLWIHPGMGPGKIHVLGSNSGGTHRVKVLASIHGQNLSGEYHNDADFYLELINMISHQVLYELDYELKNNPEVLDNEE